jgi:hypothetical protein
MERAYPRFPPSAHFGHRKPHGSSSIEREATSLHSALVSRNGRSSNQWCRLRRGTTLALSDNPSNTWSARWFQERGASATYRERRARKEQGGEGKAAVAEEAGSKESSEPRSRRRRRQTLRGGADKRRKCSSCPDLGEDRVGCVTVVNNVGPRCRERSPWSNLGVLIVYFTLLTLAAI